MILQGASALSVNMNQALYKASINVLAWGISNSDPSRQVNSIPYNWLFDVYSGYPAETANKTQRPGFPLSKHPLTTLHLSTPRAFLGISCGILLSHWFRFRICMYLAEN